MSKCQVRSKLLEILQDHQWHSFNELVVKTRHLISPEIACRAYITKNGDNTDKRRKDPIDIQAANGKRMLVMRILRRLKRSKLIEQQGKAPDSQYNSL